MKEQNKTNKLKRLFAIILAVTMIGGLAVSAMAEEPAVEEEIVEAVSMEPVTAEPALIEEVPAIEAEPVYTEEPTVTEEPETPAPEPAQEEPVIPVAADPIAEEPAPREQLSDVFEANIEDEVSDAQDSANIAVLPIEDKIEEMEEETVPEDTEEPDSEKTTVFTIDVSFEGELTLPGTSEDLLDEYVERKMGESLGQLYTDPRGTLAGYSFTDEVESALYSLLRQKVKAIADGNAATSLMQFTMGDLGVAPQYTYSELGCSTQAAAKKALKTRYEDSALRVVYALLYDCPYDFYWALYKDDSYKYEGTVTLTVEETSMVANGQTSYSVRVINGQWDMKFPVYMPFRSSTDMYKIDTAKTQAVTSALEYAQQIVNAAKGKSDYDKLVFYRDAICSLTEYDYGFSDASYTMINVFDRNTNTKTVCSGYAKAFQYLCDLTDFNSPVVQIYTMYGYVPGAHVWNIAHMENGKNYLIDTTFYDRDTRYKDQYFMAGYTSGNVTNGYKYGAYTYRYSVSSSDPYIAASTIYESSLLTLSASSYLSDIANKPIPGIPSVSIVVSGSDVTLRWGTTANTSRYAIYRSEISAEKGFHMIADIAGSNTSYTDTSAKQSGKTYWYKVYAYRLINGKIEGVSGDSNVSRATINMDTSVKSITNRASGPELQWYGNANAARYNVYRKSTQGDYICVGSTTGTVFLDTSAVSGTLYYYTVCCANQNGVDIEPAAKEMSNIWLASPGIMPVAASGTEYTSSGIILRWTGVPGAQSYKVLRTTQGVNAVTELTNTIAEYFHDTKVSAGQTYVYTVIACKNGYESLRGANSLQLTYYLPPTISGIVNTAGGLKVTWSAVSSAAGYDVYRTEDNSNYTYLGRTTGISFIDASALSGRTYRYAVCAVNTAGVQISYYGASAWRYCLSTPTLQSMTPGETGYVLQWTKVPGASGYQVFRQAYSTGKWTTLATITNGSTLTYTDPVGANNLTERYTYVVWAYYGSSVSSDYSNTKVAYPIPKPKSIAKVSNGIKTTWTAVSGISKYAIYRRTNGGSWQYIGMATGTSYTDKTVKSGKTYEYSPLCLASDGVTLLSYGWRTSALKY